MKRLVVVLVVLVFANAAPSFAQSRWTVELSAGAATPVGDIASRLSTGWNADLSAGPNLTSWLTLLGEFSFASMKVPQSVLDEFSAPVGHGRIFTVSVDPEVRFPVTRHLRGFVIGGAGWVHRAVDLTAPTVAYVDYYDPFYGDLGPTPIQTESVISSVTRNAIGENIGGGVSYPISAIGAELFAAVRYWRAPTSPRTTSMVPVMFGVRWLPKH